MTTIYLILGILLCAIVVDIIVRLMIASRARERLIKDVLDTMMEPDAASVGDVRPGSALDELGIHLLLYFKQSTASRDVLTVLADAPEPLSEHALVVAVDRLRREQHKRDLPSAAVLNASRILRGARLVEAVIDGVQITEAGRQLNERVQQPHRLARRYSQSFAASPA